MDTADHRRVALEPLDLDTLTVALMRSMRMPQSVIDDEDTRLGATQSASRLLAQLPPLYVVRIK
jgi:hypothetical protein